jgi:hypothetical protein
MQRIRYLCGPLLGEIANGEAKRGDRIDGFFGLLEQVNRIAAQPK